MSKAYEKRRQELEKMKLFELAEIADNVDSIAYGMLCDTEISGADYREALIRIIIG